MADYLTIHGDVLLYSEMDNKEKTPVKTKSEEYETALEMLACTSTAQVQCNENDNQNAEQPQVTTSHTTESLDIDVETLFRHHQPPTTYIPFGPITPTFARVHSGKDLPSTHPTLPMDLFDNDNGDDDDFYLIDDPPPLLHSTTCPKNPFRYAFEFDDEDDMNNNNGESFDDAMLWEYTSTPSLSNNYYHYNNYDDKFMPHSSRYVASMHTTKKKNRERVRTRPRFGARS